MRRAALVFLAAALSADAQEAPRQEGRIRREIEVARVTVDAYVTDRRNEPIEDLDPADFRVRVDGREVEVESADWIPADEPEATPPPPSAPGAAPGAPAELNRSGFAAAAPENVPPGRLIVIFIQSDLFQTVRLKGLMRNLNTIPQLLEKLLPTDRVAVVSYDSHLKFRQDFTNDPAALYEAFYQGLLANEPPRPETWGSTSLARHFDFDAAKKAYTVERGLALVAEALAPFPGAKTILFFGWGLYVNRNPSEMKSLERAYDAMSRARINVFMLDVTDADYHTLEGGLMVFAEATGGTYQKTHIFPALALELLQKTLSGHYVLVFVRPDLPKGGHRIDVALRKKRGTVTARGSYVDVD